jgi:peptidoglycan/xylan/chitin deacetylase (PgdA/CDA1 family)
VQEGSTVAEASEQLELRPPAGDLVSVTGETLRLGAFPGHVLVNGQAATPDTELAADDRLDLVAGRTRREPTDRVVVRVPGGVPANPQRTLARYPALEAERGRVSADLDRATMAPTGALRVPDAVALTFDDGPAAQTRAVLETLRRLRAPATFFFVGERAQNNPKLVQRARAYGMAVENHSFSHPYAPAFSERTRTQIDEEIARGAAAIASLADPPTLFRPPGGTHSALVLDVARDHGQHVVLWSVDSEDWKAGVTARQITRRVLQSVRPGSIVLLHDGPSGRTETVKALPAIVRGIRARGLDLTLIEER